MEVFNLYTNSFLSDKRKKGDVAADEFIAFFFENKDLKKDLFNCLNALKSNSDLQNLSPIYSNFQLISEIINLPPWQLKEEIKIAQSFFALHSEMVMNLLGLLSLPYCYAAANGAMVLQQTARLQYDVGKRLLETAEFVWDLMAPNTFSDDGKGFISILKVRLMHAAARYYIINSNTWNDDYGTPVNQEDMAGTNLSFSLIVIRGMRKSGITISYREQMAFIHLWNVIGFLLGLDEDLLPRNGKEATLLEQSIRIRQFKQSEHGKSLCRGLTDYLKLYAKNGSGTESEILGLMNYLLGNEIAGIIGLPSQQLPSQKISFLKIINSLKYLSKNENVLIAYQHGYNNFQKEKLMIL